MELFPSQKRGAVQKAAAKLLDAGFLEEVRARGTLPVWRRDEEKGAMALRITRRGLAAIRVEDKLPKDEAAAVANSGRWARRGCTIATPAQGDKAGCGSHPPKVTGSSGESRRTPVNRSNKRRGTGPQSAAEARPAPLSPPRMRADSKQAHVIAIVGRPEGATIAAIMEATGWQQHSVRGFFASLVRQKLSLTLVSDKTEAGRFYRIVAADAPDQPAVPSERAAA